MSRNPRSSHGPSLTRTEQLRQAKTAALVRTLTQKEEATARQSNALRARRRLDRPEPKKVDFSKPGMTKSMIARMKQAEKFKQEYERKREGLTSGRIPARTAAPIGGDARMGREPGSRARHQRGVAPSTSAKVPRRPKSPEQLIPKKTAELAKVMNADIIQAEQVGTGPITNIVIPPGTINEENTTIVNVISASAAGAGAGASQIANRSIQVISETLNDQDAAESAAVQNKLADLQQARRDFVIAVANVGGNAVNIEGETSPPVVDTHPTSSKSRYIVKLPDVEDRYLQPVYGVDHPDVVAARAHMAKMKSQMEARDAARRIEEEFEKIAAEQLQERLQYEVPYEEENYSDQNAEEFYQYGQFDPDELERFFDVQRFPPCVHCGPPPGKENLHRDLWELDDPWYIPPPQADVPDLIQFD